MNLTEITSRNYKATCKRGLISGDTKKVDFVYKLFEEVSEFHNANGFEQMNQELADITLVCFSIARHYNIDLIAEMEKKVMINEKRVRE